MANPYTTDFKYSHIAEAAARFRYHIAADLKLKTPTPCGKPQPLLPPPTLELNASS
jgi:hypothetical protein